MHAAFSVLALLASTAAAQSTDLNIFVGGNANQKYVGSVVAVSGSDTTLALVCTAGVQGVGLTSSSCDGSETATVTYFGTSEWRQSSSAHTSDVTVIISESCTFKGTTQGICTESISAKLNGVSSSTVTTSTISGTALRFASVPITGGVSKLASATKSGNAAAPTMGTELYKIIIVPGTAALLAGAALL